MQRWRICLYGSVRLGSGLVKFVDVGDEGFGEGYSDRAKNFQ